MACHPVLHTGRGACSACKGLHHAAFHGHESCIIVLLRKCRADQLDARDKSGGTPLIMAARRGKQTCLQALLEAGSATTAENQEGFTALHIAANEGHSGCITALITAGARANTKNAQNGLTPLILSASCGHAAAVECLVVSGKADVNLCAFANHSALHWASRNGHVAVMELLLTANADIHLKTDNGLTALHVAAEYGPQKSVSILLAARAAIDASDNAGHTALYKAVTKERSEIIQLLLLHGATVDVALPLIIKAESLSGYTHASQQTKELTAFGVTSKGAASLPMQVTLAAGGSLPREGGSSDSTSKVPRSVLKIRAHAMKITLEQETVDDGVTKRLGVREEVAGRTPLHTAVLRGNAETVGVLLECSASVLCRDSEGNSALHMAARIGSEGIMEKLLKEKPDINGVNKEDLTPLHFAARFGFGGCVVLLLIAGANARGANTDPTTTLTPIHLASYHGHANCVCALLAGGAVAERASIGGATPLHLAVVNNHHKCIRILLECGANMDAVDDRGITSLHLASSAGHTLIIQHLLVLGANVDRMDVQGSSALHYAVTMQQHTATQLLIEGGADTQLMNHQGIAAKDSPVYVPPLRVQPPPEESEQASDAAIRHHRLLQDTLYRQQQLHEQADDAFVMVKEAAGEELGAGVGLAPGRAMYDDHHLQPPQMMNSMETERRVENICGTVEGSGVHVKKWTYAVEEDKIGAPHENKALVGKDGKALDAKQQRQISTGADSAYMAFSAASGVAQTNETLIQLDAAAQLDIFLDGLDETSVGSEGKSQLEESLAGSGVALQASSAEATGSDGEGALGWFAAVQNQRLTRQESVSKVQLWKKPTHLLLPDNKVEEADRNGEASKEPSVAAGAAVADADVEVAMPTMRLQAAHDALDAFLDNISLAESGGFDGSRDGSNVTSTCMYASQGTSATAAPSMAPSTACLTESITAYAEDKSKITSSPSHYTFVSLNSSKGPSQTELDELNPASLALLNLNAYLDSTFSIATSFDLASVASNHHQPIDSADSASTRHSRVRKAGSSKAESVASSHFTSATQHSRPASKSGVSVRSGTTEREQA